MRVHVRVCVCVQKRFTINSHHPLKKRLKCQNFDFQKNNFEYISFLEIWKFQNAFEFSIFYFLWSNTIYRLYIHTRTPKPTFKRTHELKWATKTMGVIGLNKPRWKKWVMVPVRSKATIKSLNKILVFWSLTKECVMVKKTKCWDWFGQVMIVIGSEVYQCSVTGSTWQT